ncbi:hypothetical protein AMTRI_Chr02g224180 [Amborella trichopoda]
MKMKELKRLVAVFVSFGVFAMVINLRSNGPFFYSKEANLLPNFNKTVVLEKPQLKAIRKEIYRQLWRHPEPVLQPCWDKHLAMLKTKPWGFLGVRLSKGPHYHRIQVAEAVVIAKYVSATLLLPTIKDGDKEPNGQFDNIYHPTAFIMGLQNVLRVVGRLPEDMSSVTPTVINVPYGATPKYIEENIRPIFRQKALVIIDNFFYSNKLEEAQPELEALKCLVMYKALKFHPNLIRLGNHIIDRMREAGEVADGRFICLDLRVEYLLRNGCNFSMNEGDILDNKKCVNVSYIGGFLERIGFPEDTAIYLTQSRWDMRLNPLGNTFLNIHTKEYSMPFNEEKQILYSGNTQFERALDFYICSRSDVFVPASSGMFYTHVAGERILLGNTHILVPFRRCSSLTKDCPMSRYVTRREHFVYKCACAFNYTEP